jgi:hypothetical protein
MSHLFRFLFIIFAFSSVSLYAFPTTLDPDGGLRLAGERWFPLGLYEVPENATQFQRIENAGFDLVRANLDKRNLDQIAGHGLQAWIPIGGLAEVSDEAAAGRLREAMAPLKDHPALALWELPDEALWNCMELRWAASNKERSEIREKVNAAIRSGSPEAETLKDLYREMVRAHRHWDFPGMEAAIRKLWDALGEPEREVATNLSGRTDCEEKLFPNLLAGYRLLRKEDPAHLVWQNHAPRNSAEMLQKHSAYCDVWGCDIYPAPDYPAGGHSDLSARSLAAVGDYTERFKDLAPSKSTLMVLQGFGWKNLGAVGEDDLDKPRQREPKYLESRFMAYDAIARGADGLAYWGTAYDPEDKAWESLVPVIQELAALQIFLAAPAVPLPLEVDALPSWTSRDREVAWTARRVGEDWLFIFANEEDQPQKIHVAFPPEFAGTRLYLLYEDLYVEPVEGGLVELDFVGYGVRLLSTRRDLEVHDLRKLDREMEDPFPGSSN